LRVIELHSFASDQSQKPNYVLDYRGILPSSGFDAADAHSLFSPLKRAECSIGRPVINSAFRAESFVSSIVLSSYIYVESD
jgi:hypothetical protein